MRRLTPAPARARPRRARHDADRADGGHRRAGLLLASAAPFFGDMVVNSRLREAGNLLLTETLMAQSEAIKRNTRATVSTSTASCACWT
jgi:hypothetical protein